MIRLSDLLKEKELAKPAKIYAESLINSIHTAEEYGRVEKQLEQIEAVIKENTILYKALTIPIISVDKKVKIMQEVANRLKAGDGLGRFLSILVINERLSLLKDIIILFKEMADEKTESLRMHIAFASEPAQAMVDRIADRLGRAFGKKLIITREVDPSILGGMLIKIGSKVYDGTISKMLENLTQKMQLKGNLT